MYHTQECRDHQLVEPCPCTRDDAWLGDGYYFWDDLYDAEHWGHKSKKRTGQFEVYESRIDCSNVLNTVFNEEHYLWWLKQINKAAKSIVRKTGEKPTLKELNDYFKERATWDEVDGILFQDLPNNFNISLVKPMEYGGRKRSFVYRKRIQLAVYNLKILVTFALRLRAYCQK